MTSIQSTVGCGKDDGKGFNTRTVLLLEDWEGGYITTISDGTYAQVQKCTEMN